jgi:hypothetical protein
MMPEKNAGNMHTQNLPKSAMVIFSNACSKPYTVMIELKGTLITVMTVSGTRWLQGTLLSKVNLDC